MSYVLAFDTAMAGCSVCVFNTETKSAVKDMRMMARGQSELLVPMIDGVIKQAGITFQDIALIVTTVGPGAFTGLRIGLSAARSFGLALDVPVAGVTTTEILAEKFFSNNNGKRGDLLALLETKRADLYFQSYEASGKPRAEAGVASIESILTEFAGQTLTLCGDGVERLRETLEGDNIVWPAGWFFESGYDMPDPLVMAKTGYAQFRAGIAKPADPVYLRGADVSVSNRPQRTIAGAEE
jgi:tRNA threonylcarbamoyladenosine biosynthesis protein TsaB